MKRWTSALVVVALTFSLIPVPAFAQPVHPTLDYVRDSVLVKLRYTSSATIAGLARKHGLRAQDVRSGSGGRQLSVRVPSGKSVDQFIGELKSDGNVEYADRDYIRGVSSYTVPPNDPEYASSLTWSEGSVNYAYGKSWWLRNSGANSFWGNYNNGAAAFPTRATGDTFKIGVIDTGFYMNHPDKGANIVAGRDEFQSYTNGVFAKDSDVTPASENAPNNDRMTAAHGTCVAGEIAAATGNGTGVASVGYDNRVVVYKVQGIWTAGDPANGYPAGSAVILDQAIVDAIYDATNDGCRVINMSLGGSDPSSAMQAAIDYAYGKGVVIVAATGNDGANTNFYPAAANHVIGVGSYGLSGTSRVRSSFTNFGTQLDVLSPGQMVYGLTNPSYNAGAGYATGYEFWDGTSMASPAFAGMLAMVWRFAPALTNAEITSYMLSSATAVGAQPNTDYGYGYANPANAYAKIKSDLPYLAKPSFTTTKTTYATKNVSVAWAGVSGRSVQYRVVADGTTSTQTASTVSLSGLADGTHTVDVTPVSAYNWYLPSNDVQLTFSVDTVAPAAPAVSYDSATRLLSWTDSEAGDHTTQLAVDTTVSPTVVAGTSRDLSTVAAGVPHTAYVRFTDAAGNVGPWGSVTFGRIESPPVVPVLLAYDPIGRRVEWVDEETGAHTTEFALDTTSAPRVIEGTACALPPDVRGGLHTAYVRVTGATGDAGPWVAVSFTVVDPVAVIGSELVLDRPSFTIAWGSAAALAGGLFDADGLPLAGRQVTVEGSRNGGTSWASVCTVTTGADGGWRATWAPGVNAQVRVRYSGDDTRASAVSEQVAIRQRVYLSTPSVASHVHKGRSFTPYGYLKPRHASGTSPVRIAFYRRERQRSGSYAWVLRKTVSGKAYSYWSYTKYSVRTSLPSTGSWKAVASYVGSAAFTSTTSGSRYFTVR
jgi:hypothetical protein